MNLSLVHEWLTTWGGSEAVFLRFLKFLHPREAFCLFLERNKQTEAFKSFDIQTTFFQKSQTLRRHYQLFLPLMPFAFQKLKIRGEWVLTNCHAFAKCAPKRHFHICYCYTPVRYLWIMPEVYLEALPKALRPAARALLPWLRKVDLRAASSVDQFVAISNTVKKRIKKIYGKKAYVIYPPIDTLFLQAPLNHQKEDFYLFVGRLTPYKRADLAVLACKKLRRKLIVVGEGKEKRKLEQLAGSQVTFFPFLPKRKLFDLLLRAKALIFCAYEDFGLVPLEALSCATPVIAFGRGGVAEYARDGVTGTLFNEQTVNALVDALLRFEKSSFDPYRLKQIASSFSPQNFCQKWQAFLRVQEARA